MQRTTWDTILWTLFALLVLGAYHLPSTPVLVAKQSPVCDTRRQWIVEECPGNPRRQLPPQWPCRSEFPDHSTAYSDLAGVGDLSTTCNPSTEVMKRLDTCQYTLVVQGCCIGCHVDARRPDPTYTCPLRRQDDTTGDVDNSSSSHKRTVTIRTAWFGYESVSGERGGPAGTDVFATGCHFTLEAGPASGDGTATGAVKVINTAVAFKPLQRTVTEFLWSVNSIHTHLGALLLLVPPKVSWAFLESTRYAHAFKWSFIIYIVAIVIFSLVMPLPRAVSRLYSRGEGIANRVSVALLILLYVALWYLFWQVYTHHAYHELPPHQATLSGTLSLFLGFVAIVGMVYSVRRSILNAMPSSSSSSSSASPIGGTGGQQGKCEPKAREGRPPPSRLLYTGIVLAVLSMMSPTPAVWRGLLSPPPHNVVFPTSSVPRAYVIPPDVLRDDVTRQGKVVIAANFYNNDEVLPYLTQSLLTVVEYFGRDNVYISIFENGSTDNTKTILSDFKTQLAALGVSHSVVISSAPKARFGGSSLKRIQYMAGLRNKLLDPVISAVDRGEFQVSRILFVNDVYFTLDDVLHLFYTRNMDYNVVCAMDHYYSFYDTWVTRDINGREAHGMYPYFKDPGSRQLVREGLPIAVTACWNGITVYDAAPYMSRQVVFRGRSDVHEDPPPESGLPRPQAASECCLSCLDFHSLGRGKVYINPQVKVNYEWWTYYFHRYIATYLNVVYDAFFDIDAFHSHLDRLQSRLDTLRQQPHNTTRAGVPIGDALCFPQYQGY